MAIAAQGHTNGSGKAVVQIKIDLSADDGTKMHLLAGIGEDRIVDADQRCSDTRLELQIKAIRARSNEIEAMNPIPADMRDDSYWSAT